MKKIFILYVIGLVLIVIAAFMLKPSRSEIFPIILLIFCATIGVYRIKKKRDSSRE